MGIMDDRVEGFVNRLSFSSLMKTEVMPAIQSWDNIAACGIPLSKYEAYGMMSEEKFDARLSSFFVRANSLTGVEVYEC